MAKENKMRKMICSAAALWMAVIMMLSLTACDTPGEKSIDVYALADEMAAAAELPEMLTINKGDSNEEKGFAAISDLDYAKVAAFRLMYASNGSAYELAVIKLTDASDMKKLEESLKEHIEKRVKQYRQYNAEEVPRAEGAAVVTNGAYAALIMCDDTASAKAVFERAFILSAGE